jgi:hypothetical protein
MSAFSIRCSMTSDSIAVIRPEAKQRHLDALALHQEAGRREHTGQGGAAQNRCVATCRRCGDSFWR